MSRTAPPSPPRSRRWPRHLAILGFLSAGLWLLLFSWSPAVPARARPSAAEVAAGRAAIYQLRFAQGSPGTEVTLDRAMLDGLTALAGDASGRRHVDARLEDGRLTGVASLRTPIGWLNLTGTVTGAHRGFPPIDATVGHLPLPRFVTRVAARFGHWLLRRRGADLPPLDRMVPSLRVRPASVSVALVLPERTGIVDSALTTTNGVSIDPARAAAIVCRLSQAQKLAPVDELAPLVRRAFGGQDGTPDTNRATLVALAILVVPDQARGLFPLPSQRSAPCLPIAGPTPTLHGRADLAKHWTLSAALGARLGGDAAGAIGEWKEMADSDGGSGFSFVDLAADRAGVRSAARAGDPDAGDEEAAALAAADDDTLLPVTLTDGPEGLTQRQFNQRYGALDAARYGEAVRTIDRMLDAAGR